MIYQFDQFEVDDREFRLSDAGTPVQLEPKALRLLVYLIENRNRLVRKQELLDKVWPDAMVTENALTRAIGLLRKALNEDSRVPRYIETVPTAGYRFIANVSVSETNPEASPAARPGTESTPIAAQPMAESHRRLGSSSRLILAAILLVVVAAAATFLYLRPRKKVLTEKDTIVLADFDNSTGDPVFDGTLRRGMAVQLEQSPFLSLIDDDRIQQVLRLMSQPADARLTPAVAREICERTASAAVLDGSIALLGNQYVLGLRATGCRNGRVLAEEQVQAARKEDVLGALDRISGKFRTRVGESLTTVEKYDTPLAEATTPSFEALKAYSLASNRKTSGAQIEAISLLRRAVELDPNFAAAYASLASAYETQREPELAAEASRKAYELRGKVSERERLSIEVNYYWRQTGELEKAQASLELLQQIYPRDNSHTSFVVLYRRLGQLEHAEQESSLAVRLMPDVAVTYQNLGADLVSLNRFDEADAVYRKSDELHLPYAGRAKSLYLLAFLKGDQVRMAQMASSVMGKRGEEDAMLGAQADTAAWYGQQKAAREFNRRAMDSALANDARETAAAYLVKDCPFWAFAGEREHSRADALAALKLAPNRDVHVLAALTLSQAGDTAAAERLAAEVDKAFPVDTLVQRYWLPVIRASLALQRNDPQAAIAQLQGTGPLELSAASLSLNPSLFPAYVRGLSYLMLHDGAGAAHEFQKFIEYRGDVRNAPMGVLAGLGLARAYAMQGDTPKARAAYQDFLTTWKDADADLPIFIQAKAEYAKLQ
jgi:eukaryotic-like serine/threonine-protein kinase